MFTNIFSLNSPISVALNLTFISSFSPLSSSTGHVIALVFVSQSVKSNLVNSFFSIETFKVSVPELRRLHLRSLDCPTYILPKLIELLALYKVSSSFEKRLPKVVIVPFSATTVKLVLSALDAIILWTVKE